MKLEDTSSLPTRAVDFIKQRRICLGREAGLRRRDGFQVYHLKDEGYAKGSNHRSRKTIQANWRSWARHLEGQAVNVDGVCGMTVGGKGFIHILVEDAAEAAAGPSQARHIEVGKETGAGTVRRKTAPVSWGTSPPAGECGGEHPACLPGHLEECGGSRRRSGESPSRGIAEESGVNTSELPSATAPTGLGPVRG